MIDLFSLYQSFQVAVNTFQGGFWRIQSDFTQACNDISNDLWIEQTRMAEKAQEVRDNLMPFLVKKNVICEKKGIYSYVPSGKLENYGRFASCGIMIYNNETVPDKDVDSGDCCNGEYKSDEEIAEDYYENVIERTVDLVGEQRWKASLEHLTKKPMFENPKMVQQDNGWYVSPASVGVVVLSYYRRPKDAVFAYTVDTANLETGGGDNVIYDKNASTPLEWGNDLRNEFIIRLGIKYGLFSRDQFLVAANKSEK